MRSTTTALALLLLSATGATSQEPGHAYAESPYVNLQGREIKALSEEETRDLLEGEGMGFALAAELNGYPGPRHVLELADSLGLTPEQRARTRGIMEAMLGDARRLGARIVEGERALDRAFSAGSIDEAQVRRKTAELGALRGELRGVHLAAHLALVGVLDPHQVHRYQELRGYGEGHGHGGGS